MDLAETQRDAYLRAMRAREKAQEQIEPTQALDDERKRMQEARSTRNASLGFQRAANQVGNFQGRAAGSEALEGYTNAQNAQDREDFAGREMRSQNAARTANQEEDRTLALGAAVQKEEELDSPVAPEVVGIANEFLEKQGAKSRVPEGITQRQLKANPYLSQLIKNSSARAGMPKTYMKDVFDENNMPQSVLFDGITGEPIRNLGRPVTGTSLVKNEGTGLYESIQKNGGGGAAPMSQPGGRNPAQVKADLDVATSVRKEDATRGPKVETVRAEAKARDEAKAVGEIRGEKAKADAWKGVANDAMALYDKSTLVGPIGGRVTKVAGAMGLAPDENASRLNTMLMRRINSYVKEITGAAMSASEQGRIMSVMPSVSDSKSRFRIQLEELKKEADRLVEERRMASPQGARESAPSSSAPKVFKAGEIPDLNGGK
jgi:hypothetical protein